MKISIITPTHERRHYLQGAYQLIQNQTYTNWEWLIYDTSLRPTHFADARVIYMHDEAIVTIGEKRNRLKERASGDIVVHFDDDDYYAPTYLDMVLRELQKVSFFTVHSWFSYDSKTGQFYYWDTEELGEIRYFVSPISGSRIREVELGPYLEHQKIELNDKGRRGYGFSFAYTKEIAHKCFFRDLDLAEDRHFFDTVETQGFSIATLADQKGVVIHVIHNSNTSSEFPQYRIPQFLVAHLFPNFFPYAMTFHEN